MITATNYHYKKQKINFTSTQTNSQSFEEKSTLGHAVCSFIQPGIGQMIEGDNSKGIKHLIGSIAIPVLSGALLAGIGKFFKKDFMLNLAGEVAGFLAILTRIHSVFDIINPNNKK